MKHLTHFRVAIAAAVLGLAAIASAQQGAVSGEISGTISFPASNEVSASCVGNLLASEAGTRLFASLTIDGTAVWSQRAGIATQLPGTAIDWVTPTYTLTPGTHTIVWEAGCIPNDRYDPGFDVYQTITVP